MAQLSNEVKKIDSIEDMMVWLNKAKEGSTAEYYSGDLYTDRQRTRFKTEALKIADLAWKAYETSKVTLVQKKLGENKYSYRMQHLGVRWKMVT